MQQNKNKEITRLLQILANIDLELTHYEDEHCIDCHDKPINDPFYIGLCDERTTVANKLSELGYSIAATD